jgi:hypothetical protein
LIGSYLQEVAVDTKEEIVVVAEAVAEVEVEVEVGVVGAAETAIGFAPIQGDFFFFFSDLRFVLLFLPLFLVALSFYGFGV